MMTPSTSASLVPVQTRLIILIGRTCRINMTCTFIPRKTLAPCDSNSGFGLPGKVFCTRKKIYIESSRHRTSSLIWKSGEHVIGMTRRHFLQAVLDIDSGGSLHGPVIDHEQGLVARLIIRLASMGSHFTQAMSALSASLILKSSD